MCRFWKKNEETTEVNEVERFRKEVKDARRLLDFAISEGADVGDVIISEINQAVTSLDSDHPPCPQQRAAFDKSYRDLVKVIHPVTIESLGASSFFSGWRRKFLTFGLIFLILFVFYVLAYDTPANISWRYILLFFFISFSIVGLLWFLDLFTGIIFKHRFIEIIIISYAFTAFALLGSIAMFAFLGWAPKESGAITTTLEKIMAKAPIGILKGCVAGENQQSDLNGGVAGEAQQANLTGGVARENQQGENDWIPQELMCKNGADNKVLAQWVINFGGTTVPIAAPKTDGQGVVAWPPMQIHGGAVVPLYVVILSLIGGAISMTRRVPEYQRRVYLRPENTNHLAREDARQFLVFQVMQFFTAPLIAITAYYLLEPDTRKMSVVLGFTAGFASEVVLGAIRGLVAKLGPAEAQPGTTIRQASGPNGLSKETVQ